MDISEHKQFESRIVLGGFGGEIVTTGGHRRLIVGQVLAALLGLKLAVAGRDFVAFRVAVPPWRQVVVAAIVVAACGAATASTSPAQGGKLGR